MLETSSSCTASRRATSARNSTSLSSISSTMSWSRSSRTVETRSRLTSSVLSCSSFSATLDDSRRRPSSAPRNSSGVLRVRSASVVSDSASWSVSICAEVEARPSNASTTSNGEEVRSAGMGAALVELAAAGRLERQEHRPEDRLDLDLGAGVAAEVGGVVDLEAHPHLSPSSSTSSTLPTRTPAMRTSSLTLSPPASVNIAW